MENVYIHTQQNHFSGQPGFDENGMPAEIDLSSSDQFSFALQSNTISADTLDWSLVPG